MCLWAEEKGMRKKERKNETKEGKEVKDKCRNVKIDDSARKVQ